MASNKTVEPTIDPRVLVENAVIIDRDVIVDLYLGFEKLLRFVGGLLYASSKKAGVRTAERLSQRGLVRRENAFQTLLWSFVIAGYASRVTVEKVEKRKKEVVVELRVEGTLLGSRIGKRKKPVDQPLTGFLAGWLEHMYSARVDARETECIAAGAPACRFVIKIHSLVELDITEGQVFDRSAIKGPNTQEAALRSNSLRL